MLRRDLTCGLAGWDPEDEQLSAFNQLWIRARRVVLHIDEVCPAAEKRRRDHPGGFLIVGEEAGASGEEPVRVVLRDARQRAVRRVVLVHTTEVVVAADVSTKITCPLPFTVRLSSMRGPPCTTGGLATSIVAVPPATRRDTGRDTIRLLLGAGQPRQVAERDQAETRAARRHCGCITLRSGTRCRHPVDLQAIELSPVRPALSTSLPVAFLPPTYR